MDVPFPQISPESTPEDIRKQAEAIGEKIVGMNPDAVLAAGEFSFTFMLVDYLLKHNIEVVTSCSARNTVEVKNPDGTSEKTSVFAFMGYRKYEYFFKEKEE